MTCKILSFTIVFAAGTAIAGCGSSAPRFTTIREKAPESRVAMARTVEGFASYYAEEFNGRKTASGEIYNMRALTAAHRTLPFNTILRVSNLNNGRTVRVRVNDRGPFKEGRIIDLSLEAARRLGIIPDGTASVKIEVVELGPSGE